MKERKLKIALFHPWLKSKGGAERVVLEFLKNTIHKVEVYTWVYKKDSTFEEFENFKVNVIAPRFLEKFSNKFILRGIFTLFGLFSKIDLRKYDLFFISTSGVAEFITFRNYKEGKTYAFVHTILRDSYKDNIKWNLKYRYRNPVNKLLYLGAVLFYRILERIAWRKIDCPIFNSELSKKRAEQNGLLKDKRSYIVHPPMNLKVTKKVNKNRDNFFLYVSRFNLLKRQDVLIEAWKEFQKSSGEYKKYKLVLVGGFENEKYMSRVKDLIKKGDEIEIKLNISDKELKELYSKSLAVLFVPFLEDFGIVPFEALSFGKPLIAVEGGGYMDLIKNSPNLIKIKEKLDRELMIKEIAGGIETFIKNKNRFNYKPEQFPELAPLSFTGKIEDIFLKRSGF